MISARELTDELGCSITTAYRCLNDLQDLDLVTDSICVGPDERPKTGYATLSHDHTLQDLADTFLDGPGPEMMRRRMERYGIERDNETLSQLLQAANPDDAGDPLPDAFAEGSRGERA